MVQRNGNTVALYVRVQQVIDIGIIACAADQKQQRKQDPWPFSLRGARSVLPVPASQEGNRNPEDSTRRHGAACYGPDDSLELQVRPICGTCSHIFLRDLPDGTMDDERKQSWAVLRGARIRVSAGRGFARCLRSLQGSSSED